MAPLTPMPQLMGQAQQAIGLRQENMRKQAAYNALRDRYGAMAGDPRAALQLQQHGFREDANPLRLQGMETKNALSQQQLAFREQHNPLRIESAELANRDARGTVRESETERNQDALYRGATHVRRRIAEGADPGAAYDEVAPFLPITEEQSVQVRERVTGNPEVLDDYIAQFSDRGDMEAGLRPIRFRDAEGNVQLGQATKDGRIVATQTPEGWTPEPEVTLRDLGDRVGVLGPDGQLMGVYSKGGAPSADQSPMNPGMQVPPGAPQPVPGAQQPAPGTPSGAQQPTPGAPQPQRRAPGGLRPTPGSTEEYERQQEEQEAERTRAARRATQQRAGQTVLRSVDRALVDYLPRMNQGTGIVGATSRGAQSYVWGTDEYQFTRQIEDLSRNIGIDRLQEMRESSETGGALGQVPVQQQKMLEETMGSFDITQPPEVLEENLRQLNNNYLDIIHGSSEERRQAVERGDMSSEAAAEVEDMYYDTRHNEFGRRPGSGVIGRDQTRPERTNDDFERRFDELFGSPD